MKAWIRHRVVDPMVGQVRQGLGPRRLAWGLALGVGLGTFPVLGTTTLLCVGMGLAFRLNHPVLQVGNYLAYPLQLALLIPEVRLGERLLGAPSLPLDLGSLAASVRSGPIQALAAFGVSLGHACLGWLLVVPPVVLAAGLGLSFLFRLWFPFRPPTPDG